MGLVRYLKRLALTFWLGEMLFFAVIFAPRVFKVLSRENAGALQAAIFPAYYKAGIICSIVLLLFQAIQIRADFFKWKFLLSMFLIMGSGLIFYFSLVYLTPRIVELQPSLFALSPEQSLSSPMAQEFQHLHHLSTQLNGIVLLALLFLLGLS